MSKVFFISDLHFGHEKVSTHRGFPTPCSHDNALIQLFNNTVTKRDTCYILGDIAIDSKHHEKLLQLNGKKIIVLGNHDMRKETKKLANMPDIQLAGAIEYKGYIITHIPVNSCEKQRFKGNIHGHHHGNGYLSYDGWFYDVSVEKLSAIPVEFNELVNPKKVICRKCGSVDITEHTEQLKFYLRPQDLYAILEDCSYWRCDNCWNEWVTAKQSQSETFKILQAKARYDTNDIR